VGPYQARALAITTSPRSTPGPRIAEEVEEVGGGPPGPDAVLDALDLVDDEEEGVVGEGLVEGLEVGEGVLPVGGGRGRGGVRSLRAKREPAVRGSCSLI
jgi:hypothetical protein